MYSEIPMPVLVNRVGRDRLYTEAVESHIGGWFRNAAVGARIRPVEQPDYDFDLPASPDDDWTFTATVAVQPTPEVADWTQLEVPAAVCVGARVRTVEVGVRRGRVGSIDGGRYPSNC